MITFALVVPCAGFINVAFEVFKTHNALNTPTDNEPCRLEELVVSEQELPSLRAKADVYISRGLMAQILKGTQDNIPVAEIPVQATDLLRAINACRQRFGPDKIGLIASQGALMGARDLEDLIEDDLATYPLCDSWNGPELVRQARAEGCGVVIGGRNTCLYAQSLGMPNMLITTSRDSFLQGLTAAKHAVDIRRTEQEKTRRLQVILDASKDGILSLNAEGRIDMVNKSARRLVRVRSSDVGKKVSEVALGTELGRLILAEGECANELVKCADGAMLTVSKHNVRVDDKVCSTVVTCQEVGGIQAIESKIRTKIYSKGHVAKATFEDIVGESSIMHHTLHTAMEYSRTNSNVLLVGESGTGKELFAQSIHNASQRRFGPFVAVNCAAIPDSLLESELFGYAAGAFSGAHKSGKPGLFELAHTGTIFFDEIGEMPLHLQAKLLRAVQEREIVRLGGNAVVPVDIRIISATNQNLEQCVSAGQFRLDLFFRLDVLRINIPRLDERPEDIPRLAERYLSNNFPGTHLSTAACLLLQTHTWMGNVRHFFNVCERLAVLAMLTEGCIISEENAREALGAPSILMNRGRPALPPCGTSPKYPSTDSASADRPALEATESKVAAPQDERESLLNALAACRYNRGQAATLLRINRSTLWRKMKQYGI